MAINFKKIIGVAVSDKEQFRIFENKDGKQVLRTFATGRKLDFVDRVLSKQEEVKFDDVPF